MLVADDLGWRDTGPYGNTAIRTPHIDALARSGLLVKHAFGTTPQCSPSRISILSGRYPHATRAEDLHTPLPDGERLLPSLLQADGYFTGHMAKTHYGPNARARSSSGIRRPPRRRCPPSSTRPALGRSSSGSGSTSRTGRTRRGPIRSQHSPRTGDADTVPGRHAGTRADLALYYDAIARMDADIGSMLAELERRKLRDNTLIVFLSDNGAPFPREKGTLYDGGTRTPLIFSWPGCIRAGSVYDSGLVSTVDLAPTLLEVAGRDAAPGDAGPELPRDAHRARCAMPAARTSSASGTGTTATSTSGPCGPTATS